MLIENERYLPWCGRRYKVNGIGEISDAVGKLIRTHVINDELFVDLEWFLGKTSYSVALIVLISFGRVTLPEHLLSEVEPLYIDGDKRNLAPVNLIYRYKNGPIAVEEYPGYYYIPMYNDYAITPHGSLINVTTGKIKVWSITKEGGPKNQTGGYLYSRVINDLGFSKCLFAHRALCLAFKPYGHNVLSLVVNHKDGKPSNCDLDNLEWTTYKENNEHALAIGLRRNSTSPILMKNLKTEEVMRFESIEACARHLGHQRGYFIWYRLTNSPAKVYADMLLFKYDDDSDWPKINLDQVEVCRYGLGSGIVARNIFTGDLITFTGANRGSELTGVKAATIIRHVRDNAIIPVGGYNFRYVEFAKDWPVHSSRHLQIYEKYPIYPPDGVTFTDKETGEEKFFPSTAEAANALKITKAVLYRAMSSDALWKDRYQLKLFKLRESLGPAVA